MTRRALKLPKDFRRRVLVEHLRGLGAKVIIHDPYVPEYQGDLEKRLQGCDAVVVMVAHDAYCAIDLSQLQANQFVLIDGRHVFSAEQVAGGCRYRGVGQGYTKCD